MSQRIFSPKPSLLARILGTTLSILFFLLLASAFVAGIAFFVRTLV
ncbi:hypothetical protein [Nonomuraea jabiensis]